MRRTLTAAVSVIALAGSVLGFIRPAAALDVSDIAFDEIVSAGRIDDVASVGDRAVFTTRDGSVRTLHSTDGTVAGTETLPGTPVDGFFVGSAGGLAFVAGTDPSTGIELWSTDGTSAGTQLFGETVVGAGSHLVNQPSVGALGDRFLLGIADANGTDREPTISDGPGSALVRLADVDPGSGPESAPIEFTEVGGRAVFGAGTGTGVEPFVTDGTSAGTHQLGDIYPGPDGSSPYGFTAVGDRVVFVAYGPGGSDLYATDGVDAWPLTDLDGSIGSKPVALGDDVVFLVGNDTLWRSDGTPEGTGPAADLPLPSSGLDGTQVVGDDLYFFSGDIENEPVSLWRTDGTQDGTVEVAAGFGEDNPDSSYMAAFEGRLWFVMNDDTSSNQLWTSDGTADGTFMVREVERLSQLVATDGALYFTERPTGSEHLYRVALPPTPPTDVEVDTASNTATVSWSPSYNDNGRAITGYRVEATPGGVSATVVANQTSAVITSLRSDTEYTFTVVATNALGDSESESATATTEPTGAPSEGFAIDEIADADGLRTLTANGDRLLFTTAGDVYATEGVEGDAELLAEGAGDVAYATIDGLTFFPGTDDEHGREAWTTDGTADGTALLADADPGPGSGASNDVCAASFDDRYLLTLNDGVNGDGVWVSDGPGGDTTFVADLNESGNARACEYTEVGDGSSAVFAATRYGGDREVFVTDGTQPGTHLLSNIDPVSSSFPQAFTRVGDRVVFFASDGYGFEPYWTDGVSAGLLVDIDPDFDSDTTANVSGLLSLGDVAIFTSAVGLWSTDGTPEGTALIAPPVSTSDAAVLDGVAYFQGAGDDGTEIWRSDGTVDGTSQVADIAPGSTGSAPYHFEAFAGRVWFLADDGTGRSLWATDGTEDGTFEVASFRNPDLVQAVVATDSALYADEGDRLYRVAMAPTAPVDVDIAVTATSATVSWAEPDNDNGRAITGYDVMVGATTVHTSDTSVDISDLTPSTAYTFSVTATNDLGTSSAASASATTSAIATTTTTTSTTTPPSRSSSTSPTTRPVPTTTTTPSSPTTTTTTVAVSTGSGAVIVDEETGEVELVDPVTPEGIDAAGTVMTDDGETISVDADGTVYGGDGEPIGDLDDEDLNGDIVGIALYTPVTKANEDDELAYWLVGADGGVFSFGGAPYLGSLGGRPLAAPIVGIVPRGRGYWLVGADGGVFAFGSAPFQGSLGDRPLNAPITALTPSAAGYWLVAADGGVFTFGDARFRGSLGATGSSSPVVGLLPIADGYWLVRDDRTTIEF